MGWDTALEQREGRAFRHFLLCRGTIVCRRNAAAASRGNFTLAGYLRLLSRPHTSGRDLRKRISQTLVEPQRSAQPTWQSRYRLSGHCERVTGPVTLSQAQLAANRTDYLGDVLAHPLNDSFYQLCADMIFGNDTSSVFLATEVTNEGVEGGREEKTETGHAQPPEQHRCAQRLPHFRACSGRNGEWGNAKNE